MRPGLISFLTLTTCGEACWHAREEVCRCECGGKNHGCLRTKGGVRPVRSAKIAGARYELVAVGTYRELADAAKRMNEARGWSMIDARDKAHRYHYTHKETESGAPARLKPASKSQLKWEELTFFRSLGNADGYAYLLWKLADEGEELFHYCPDACERCDRHRAQWANVMAGGTVELTARTRSLPVAA